MTSRPLRVFLCHSSNDKPAVRELYQKLRAEPWIQPWLDEEELYPGQDWNLEIQKAIKETDAIIVCISKSTTTKEGYVQKEIKKALDFSDEKPEGAVFIIPVRLEECKPPERLLKWHYADYFEGQRERGIQRLHISLRKRAESLNIHFEKPKLSGDETIKFLEENLEPVPNAEKNNKLTLSNGMEFMRVPAGKFLMGSKDDNKLANNFEKPQHVVDIPYDFWIARCPVTNDLYNSYVEAKGIQHPVNNWEIERDYPAVNVKWADTMVYCDWLNNLLFRELSAGLKLRLPTEAEWEKAARGTDGREYPWGNIFDEGKCHSGNNGREGTVSIGSYSPFGDSSYGCSDMSSNIWEWTHSLNRLYPYDVYDGREAKKSPFARILRGGPVYQTNARCASRSDGATFYLPFLNNFVGFRVCLAPSLPK